MEAGLEETREFFVAWCREQRIQAERARQLYSSGKMHFLASNVNVSKEQIASLERVIAEMTALIERVEADA